MLLSVTKLVCSHARRPLPMTYLYYLIFYATLVVTSAQTYERPMRVTKRQADMVIQNKNINVIVNLDAKDVAKELWKVIENRMKTNDTIYNSNSKNTVIELEKVIAPLLSPTRRGASSPSIYSIANDFDHITRRALSRDKPERDSLDEEIMTRDIVADMMVSLKLMLQTKVNSKTETKTVEKETVGRRMMGSSVNNDKDYIDITVKVRKSDILKVIQ